MNGVSPSAIDRVKRFGREVGRMKVVGDIVDHLNEYGEAYLFGGGARDAFFGRGRSVNDLDVVVSGHIDFNSACFDRIDIRRTNFGGYRFHAGDFEMDVWRLDESYAFRRNPCLPVGIDSLLDTVCFTTDSIAVSLESGSVFLSTAFARAAAHSTLGFVASPEALDPLVAARAARLMLKLGLAPDRHVASYLLMAVESFGVSSLLEQEARWHGVHYLHRMSLDALLYESRRVDRYSILDL